MDRLQCKKKPNRTPLIEITCLSNVVCETPASRKRPPPPLGLFSRINLKKRVFCRCPPPEKHAQPCSSHQDLSIICLPFKHQQRDGFTPFSLGCTFLFNNAVLGILKPTFFLSFDGSVSSVGTHAQLSTMYAEIPSFTSVRGLTERNWRDRRPPPALLVNAFEPC